METFALTILSLKGRFNKLIITDYKGEKQIGSAVIISRRMQNVSVSGRDTAPLQISMF